MTDTNELKATTRRWRILRGFGIFTLMFVCDMIVLLLISFIAVIFKIQIDAWITTILFILMMAVIQTFAMFWVGKTLLVGKE